MRLSPSAAARMGIMTKQPSKYRAVRVNGFDSKREAARYQELALLEQAKQIRDLRRQPEFHCWVRGHLVTVYRSDFYYERDGQIVVEDSKGFRTRDYILKRKLVRALFGLEIVES